MKTFEDLAGHLRLRPGLPPPHNLLSTRRAWVEPLTQGQLASRLSGTLASLYSVCGIAHGHAATLALAAAAGEEAVSRRPVLAALTTETLCEHLRRICLDWPVLLGSGALPAGLIESCPAFGAGSPSTLLSWLAQHVFGMPAQSWWAEWQRDPSAWLSCWSQQGQTPVAHWLARAREATTEPQTATMPLRVHAEDTGLRALHSALQADPKFALEPVWRGRCADTGPWARLADGPASMSLQTPWLRLGARLAEVAALVLQAEHGMPRLQCGSLALAPGEGLSWLEMSRGLLVHSVRLDGQGPLARVASCRVLAPTEWNCHPRGSVAQALEATAVDADRALTLRRVHLLMAAYDPCVRFEVEPLTEHSDA